MTPNKHLSTLDINKDTPRVINPIPRRYACDACKVEFVVCWGCTLEKCPTCGVYCAQVKP